MTQKKKREYRSQIAERAQHAAFSRQPWTAQREAAVQKAVLDVLGQSPKSMQFARGALWCLKRITDSRSNPGRVLRDMREVRGDLASFEDSLKRTLRLMKRLSDDGRVCRAFGEEWKGKPSRVHRWGTFSFPTPLLHELVAVTKVAKSRVQVQRGGVQHGRRNLLIAELARCFEKDLGQPASARATSDFARIVKALLPMCGFSADRPEYAIRAGLRRLEEIRAKGRGGMLRIELAKVVLHKDTDRRNEQD